MFLHPRGPASSYKYPSPPDTLTIPVSDILTKVDAKTATGRTYNHNTKLTSQKLSTYVCFS